MGAQKYFKKLGEMAVAKQNISATFILRRRRSGSKAAKISGFIAPQIYIEAAFKTGLIGLSNI